MADTPHPSIPSLVSAVLSPQDSQERTTRGHTMVCNTGDPIVFPHMTQFSTTCRTGRLSLPMCLNSSGHSEYSDRRDISSRGRGHVLLPAAGCIPG